MGAQSLHPFGGGHVQDSAAESFVPRQRFRRELLPRGGNDLRRVFG